MARSNTTWTPEQARSMVERRRELAKLRPPTPRPDPVDSRSSAGTATAHPSFELQVLARVRAQVTGVLDLIDNARTRRRPDGQALNWLANSLERLAELERRLAGRPMPGTLKPVQPANPRASTQPQAIPLPSPAKQGEPAPALSEHLPSSNTTLHRAQLPKVEHPSTPSDQEAPDQPIDYGPLD